MQRRTQPRQRLGPDQWRVAIDNENVIGRLLQRRLCRQHRIRGATPFVLGDDLGLGEDALGLGPDLVIARLAGSDHDRRPGHAGFGDRGEDMGQERAAGDLMQDLCL